MTHLHAAVWCFDKPLQQRLTPSTHIAAFVARTLEIPLAYDEEINERPWDILLMMNGAYAFCAHLEAIARAVRRAKRIVWLQNDYDPGLKPPKPDGNAMSPFRYAFRQRAMRGKPHVDYWSTVRHLAQSTPASSYMNWNCLHSLRVPLEVNPTAHADLLYYGYARKARYPIFEYFFHLPPRHMPVTISSGSRWFAQQDMRITCIAPFRRGHFFHALNRHGLGLYIEDPKSHSEFHSPAARFYEMLSAGLPMVFDAATRTMLRKAHIDIRPYIVRSARDINRAMRDRMDIGATQQQEWHQPFVRHLRNRVLTKFHRYCAITRGDI